MVMGMESRTVLEYAAIKPWFFASSASEKLLKYFSVEAPKMIGAFIDGVVSIFLFIDVDDWPDSPVAMVSKKLNVILETSVVCACCNVPREGSRSGVIAIAIPSWIDWSDVVVQTLDDFSLIQSRSGDSRTGRNRNNTCAG